VRSLETRRGEKLFVREDGSMVAVHDVQDFQKLQTTRANEELTKFEE
jgi:hypothetical protein